MELNYQCCFCKQRIERSKVSVTSLIVISNYDKEEGTQQEQQLFCHLECLKSKLADYDKNTNDILHFLYTDDAIGPLSKIGS